MIEIRLYNMSNAECCGDSAVVTSEDDSAAAFKLATWSTPIRSASSLARVYADGMNSVLPAVCGRNVV